MKEQKHYIGLYFLLFGIFIVAATVIVAGFQIARSTYLAPYPTIVGEQVQTYVAGRASNGEIGDLRLKGDGSVYLVPTAQMTPKFSNKSYTKSSRLTLTILPNSTGYVDIHASNHVELKGPAFTVIALVVRSGRYVSHYTTPQYLSSPDGYPHDQIATGNQTMTVGVGVLVLFIMLAGMFGRGLRLSFESLPEWFSGLFRAFPEWFFGFIAGVFYIVFSFPGIMRNLAASTGQSFVNDVSSSGRAVNGVLFGVFAGQQAISFSNLWQIFIYALAAYLVGLLLLSLRYWRFDLLLSGVISLTLGMVWLHLVAWLVVLLIVLFQVAVAVLRWIVDLLDRFFGFIGGIIRNLFVFIITHGWWAVIATLLLIGAIYLVVRYREAIGEMLSQLWELIWDNLGKLGIIMLIIAGIIVVGFLLWKLFQFLLVWLAPFFALLGRIFAFLGRVLAFLGIVLLFLIYLLGIYLILATIVALGAFLLDQFKGAWHSGSGRLGVILGSLAIGVATALLLLETNLYGFVGYFPAPIATFATTNLHESDPFFDLLVAFAVIAISLLALLRNMVRLRPGPDIREFGTGVAVALLVGPLLAIVLLWGSVQSNSTG